MAGVVMVCSTHPCGFLRVIGVRGGQSGEQKRYKGHDPAARDQDMAQAMAVPWHHAGRMVLRMNMK
jgi:hypothetical protein